VITAVYRVPLRTRFRGIDVRDGVLVRGPAGWGEFSPFWDYDVAESRRWWAAAHEAACEGWPDPVRTTVPVNVTVPAVDAARAHTIVTASGCRTAKVKVAEPGSVLADDVARVRAVREAVGPQVAIRLDANQGWTPDDAVTVLRALEDADLGVELVEQPVAGEDVEGLASVRARVGLPVMADESLYSLVDLDRIIRLGAADLVNVKLAKCGSLTVGRDLLRRAEEAGLGTIVGSMMESHIGVGAAAALVAAHPTTHTPDLDAAWWSLASPVVGSISYSGNQIRMPSEPGSGIVGWATAG
jgi:L-Ala-D/L-Glu epimerase